MSTLSSLWACPNFPSYNDIVLLDWGPLGPLRNSAKTLFPNKITFAGTEGEDFNIASRDSIEPITGTFHQETE